MCAWFRPRLLVPIIADCRPLAVAIVIEVDVGFDTDDTIDGQW